MSDPQGSEDKALPASPKKLRDARGKGKVAHSRDAVTAATTLSALAYLYLRRDEIVARLSGILAAASDPATGFREALDALSGALAGAALAVLAPLLVVVTVSSLAINLILLRGVAVSFDPIIPKAEKLDPVAGFKRLFGKKSLIELVKSLVKTAALGGLLLAVAAAVLDPLVQAPRCGLPCLGTVFADAMALVLAVAAAVFVTAAVADVLLQRWLFLSDMRMTRTEAKRERKEQEGDPHFRALRRRHARSDQDGRPLGLHRATMLVTAGGHAAIGLRYVRGETPAPLVVCLGRDVRAAALIGRARERGIPVLEDPGVAGGILSAGIAPGDYAPRDQFNAIALLLSRIGD